MSTETPTPSNFIRDIVAEDNRTGKWDGRVVTRFPPEPNGYLHVGHAKAICLDFGLAADNGGRCHLRFDDTNPTTESLEFVESIQRDVRWLGFDWGKNLHHASDYFPQLYDYAQELIRRGKAYVCSLSEQDIRTYRGTVKEAGQPSPDRERPAAESLELLEGMRTGEFADGAYTLRARIDMAAANMKMRDPLIYRIRNVPHHRTGDTWHIYPMYDFAHCLSDSIEGITHSICTLEFENNRELYDWFLDALDAYHPQQIEMARLELTHTVLSKRKLLRLVQESRVSGWDDPRMPTLAALRRRGYPPAALRDFCERVGVAKRDSLVSYKQLEFSVREELNRTSPRVMTVLRPLRLVIDNYPEGDSEQLEAVNNPEDEAAGVRQVPFSKILYIEQDDFERDPPKSYHRLKPGTEVRLKHAYLVRYLSHTEDEAGNVTEVRCTYDPATRGGAAPDGRKVKGTLHWLSAAHAVDAEVRLYEHLFQTENPDDITDDLDAHLNPNSLEVIQGAKVEAHLGQAAAGTTVQFLRHGYFTRDLDAGNVWNRTVSLKDSWGNLLKRGG